MTDIINSPSNYFSNNGSLNDEDRKLFIGGLSADTNESDLANYFGQYGAVSSVTIKYNPQTGHPRGFGFITFASEASIDAVLNNCPHTLKNKQIDPRKAKTKPICKKIFVGGLNSNVNEDEIRNYFSQYGTIEGIELPYDHARNRRREFCFVIFENEESADKACYDPKQNIGGQQCDIKKAQPQNAFKQNQRRSYGSQSNGSYGNNNGYNGMSSYNEFGNNNWRGQNNGGGRSSNGNGNYRNQNNGGGYQKPRGLPRNNFNSNYSSSNYSSGYSVNPIESNNYYRQPGNNM